MSSFFLEEITLSEGVDVICSDFFDTIVYRTCHPEEIKIKWCARIVDILGLDISVEALYKHRRSCEDELGVINYRTAKETEFTYRELLTMMSNEIHGLDWSILGDDWFDVVENIEFGIETAHQYLHSDVISFLKKNGKNRQVYIISDFYHSSKFIKRLCEYHSILDLIEDVFVSSDLMSSKRSGSLYANFLKKCKLKPESIIMIGDNKHSDYDMAKAFGINAIHIARDVSLYEKSFVEQKSKNKKIGSIRTIINKDFYEFSWMAIPLYIFIRKLYFSLVRRRAENVFFLAREGEFLKALFDSFQSNFLSSEDYKIKTHYFYASRRGTYLPSLNSIDKEDFRSLIDQYPCSSLSQFLSSLGLNEYIDELKLHHEHIDFDEKHLNISLSDAYKDLISSSYFICIYDEERLARQEALCKYISSFDVRDETIYFVDVGWKGSIQDNIHKASGKKIHGYYCGLLSGALLSEENTKEGVLFRSLGRNSQSVFNEFRASFEVFCSASHGSLVKYNSGGGVELEDNKVELEIFFDKIKPIQNHIQLIIEMVFKTERKFAFSSREIMDVMVPVYLRRMSIPKRTELELFRTLKHYENFGVFDFSTFEKSEGGRLNYLYRLFIDPSGILGREWWKPLGLYNNGLGYLSYLLYLYKKITLS